MRDCPLCGSSRRAEYPYKTYKTCVECQHTYQPRPPEKVYFNPEENESNGGEGATMGDQEKAVNSSLANWLFGVAKPDSLLDIGCAYPYFAGCFTKMGVHAFATDGWYKDHEYTPDEHTSFVRTYGIDWEKDVDSNPWQNVDLITMIHVLEHFYDPIAALKRAYDNLSDNGTLYLRLPNKDVSGIERDHTHGHTLIHPNIFGIQSLLYATEKAGFYLHWLDHMKGAGQSSWIFKKYPPKVSLFMIVKNEEKNLKDCLDSIKNHVDEMIILDTGSTDDTVEIAESLGAKVYTSSQFDANTLIEDFDFSRARNEALRHATGDWLIWMDADDRFNGTKWALSPEYDAYYINIEYGGTTYNQCRMFRNNWGIRFKGAVHEFPVIDGCRLGILAGCGFTHLSEDKPNRIERNLSILEAEHQKDPNDKRTLFYLANANREAGNHIEAIRHYRRYIDVGGNFHDELVIAHYYIGLSHYLQSQFDAAISACHSTIAYDDRWAEPYSLIGECYYYKQQYTKAILYFKIAYGMPFPKTTMFVEKNRYREDPKLWISYCYEKLGNFVKAREWAVGLPKREKELSKRRYVIEVRRPGALGDVLCTTPAVKKLKEKYPDAYIRYVTHSSAIPILTCNPHIDEVVEESGKFADLTFEFSYPMKDGYPYTALKKHISHYFADCAGVELNDTRPVLNLLPEDLVKLEYKKPIISFAVKTGWSIYKEWPLERWEQLIELFPNYQFIQLGRAGEPQIKGAHYMCGKLPLRQVFSVIEQSELFVGLDSLFNHVTRALDVPAVILFGSTSPVGFGYDVNVNLWSEYECSPCYRENNEISVHPKPPCPYEHKCMVTYMSANRVAEAMKKKLRVLPTA